MLKEIFPGTDIDMTGKNYKQVREEVMSWPIEKRIRASANLPRHMKPYSTDEELEDYKMVLDAGPLI